MFRKPFRAAYSVKSILKKPIGSILLDAYESTTPNSSSCDCIRTNKLSSPTPGWVYFVGLRVIHYLTAKDYLYQIETSSKMFNVASKRRYRLTSVCCAPLYNYIAMLSSGVSTFVPLIIYNTSSFLY